MQKGLTLVVGNDDTSPHIAISFSSGLDPEFTDADAIEFVVFVV